MDKSKQELLDIISRNEDTLKKYKSRLQDVVSAHKRLILEKETLEQSLKTTLAAKTVRNVGSSRSIKNSISDDDTEESLETRINKLAQSLISLSAEKTRIESEFQADRKRLILQNKQQEDIIEDLKNQLDREKNLQAISIENAKSVVLLENYKQDTGQLALIRELQELVTAERNQKEKLENQVSNLKNQINSLNDELFSYVKLEKKLRLEIDKLKKPNRVNNVDGEYTTLDKLKKEFKLLQEQHKNALHQEKERIAESEERRRLMEIMHENRVSKLEEQLTELSALLSDYDKARQTDKEAISVLKSRLLHLEMDNINSVCEDDRRCLPKEEMINQLQHLKHQLILLCNNSEELSHLKDVLLEDLNDSKTCGTDYRTLFLKEKEEFEKYKDEIANRMPSESKNFEQVANLQKQVKNLKQRMVDLENSTVESEKTYKERIRQQFVVLEKERNMWKDKLNNCENQWHNKIILMEQELAKQRQRTLAIVSEKDQMIESLKHRRKSDVSTISGGALMDNDNSDVKSENEIEETKSQNLKSSSALLHYIQDSALKDADISRLRKENNELENKLHEFQRQVCQQEQKQLQCIQQLQETIRRLERSKDLKNEINTEYLKNVVLNFLLTTDTNKRMHMLNAIATVLHFSDIETSRIIKHQGKTG